MHELSSMRKLREIIQKVMRLFQWYRGLKVRTEQTCMHELSSMRKLREIIRKVMRLFQWYRG